MMFSYIFSNLSNYTLSTVADINETPNKVIGALKLSLNKRKKYDILNQLNSLYEVRICNFCGKSFTTGIQLKFIEQIDGSYHIVSDGHVRDKEYGKYHSCSAKSCPCKKLNSNSVEFISKCYAMSEDEALALIHSRNKSPFYACNHLDEDSYANFQAHSSIDEETKKDWHKKRIETTERNKLAFIETYGIEEWHKIMSIKKDSSSLRHFIEISSSYEEAIERYNAKCLATSQFKPEFDASIIDIRRHFQSQYKSYDIHDVESFKTECLKRLNKFGPIGKTLFINRCEQAFKNSARNCDKSMTFFLYGKIIFSINDLYEFLDIPREVISAAPSYNTKLFSYHSTIDGFYFRSDLELNFYYELKKIPHITVLSTNMGYMSGMLKKYDFKIQYNDEILFIEICSNVDQEYIDNVLNKRDMFDCILISKRFIQQFISDASNGIDLKRGDYYECC